MADCAEEISPCWFFSSIFRTWVFRAIVFVVYGRDDEKDGGSVVREVLFVFTLHVIQPGEDDH